METEEQITARYNDLADFLSRQDILGIEDVEVYEYTVMKFELLHDILELPGQPRWRS